MNNRIIPVTLAMNNPQEQKKLEKIIASSYMVRLADDESDETGVLIYEPGESVNEDLPHIIHALEAGTAEDVYLVGDNPDSEILIRAMRSGIREFLQYPIDENEFRAAIMRTAMRESLADETGEKGKIVTVLSGKPGLGTTTVAVNLAWALNEKFPGRTMLLDLRRPAGEVPYFLDLKYEYTWGDPIQDISRLDSTYLASIVTEHGSGLHVLPAPNGGGKPDAHTLYLILEQLRQAYDFVVIDTDYQEEGDLPKEIEHADTILVPMQLTLPCLARTARLIENIRVQDPDSERRMNIVANRVAKDTTIAVTDAADVLSREIKWIVPEDSASALSALNQGNPLVAAYPKSLASKEILKIAKSMDERKKTKKISGFKLPFSGLFRRKKNDSSDNLAGVAL